MKKFKKILRILCVIILSFLSICWAVGSCNREEGNNSAYAAEITNEYNNPYTHCVVIPSGSTFSSSSSTRFLIAFLPIIAFNNSQIMALSGCNLVVDDNDLTDFFITPSTAYLHDIDSYTYELIQDLTLYLTEYQYNYLTINFNSISTIIAVNLYGALTEWTITLSGIPAIYELSSSGVGGATPEDLQNAYQTGFNSGTSGIIPNVGNFETLYVNTFLNTLQVDSILNQLTYNAGVYYIYRDEYNKTLMVQKEEDTNLFTIRQIIPIQNQFINSVLYTSLDGWNYSAYGDIITNSFATVQANGLLSEYEVPSIGTYNVGSQNNLLLNLFSTIPFYDAQELFVESAGQYETGYANGEEIGYRAGYNAGVDDTLVENEINALNIFYGAVATLRILFTLVGNLLSTPIISDLTVGLFVVGIPATILILDLILAFIMRFFGRSTNTTGDSSGSDGGK